MLKSITLGVALAAMTAPLAFADTAQTDVPVSITVKFTPESLTQPGAADALVQEINEKARRACRRSATIVSAPTVDDICVDEIMEAALREVEQVQARAGEPVPREIAQISTGQR